MGIQVNWNFDWLSFWQSVMSFGSDNPALISLEIFLHGGWVVFLIVFTYLVYHTWLDSRQYLYKFRWKHTLLALDIPRNNEQTPKAVESIFAALVAAQQNPNLIEQYWEGKVQESFSFEVVSLEGYVQFLIRTPVHFRDLIEAAIYAQYPEAEITEVEDYTEPFKDLKFPNDRYDLWGTELVLVNDYPYPIRTYEEFEHGLTQTLLDPMASLLEILGRLGPGEQCWLQLIATPMPPAWKWGEKAKKVVKTILGQPYEPPQTMSDKLLFQPLDKLGTGVSSVVDAVLGVEPSEDKKKEEDQWKMFRITPRERDVLSGIQRKLSKHAFRAKYRLVYLGEKPVFSKGRGVAAVIAAIQQFNMADSNGFKPGPKSKTSADYFNVKARVNRKKRRVLECYVRRDNYNVEPLDKLVLSNEELASLWHFPVMTVKAPSVEKVASKKSVPPSRLPYASAFPGPAVDSAPSIAPELAPSLKAVDTEPVRPQAPKAPEIGVRTETAPSTHQSPQTTVRRPEPPANLPFV